MRRSVEFVQAMRGARGRTKRLVVSIYTPSTQDVISAGSSADLHPVKVGFVVPKSVGNSVLRHRLSRQLRHILRDRLPQFTAGELVAVRALPAARGVTSQELAADVDEGIRRARNKAERASSSTCGRQQPGALTTNAESGAQRTDEVGVVAEGQGGQP
ncbi:ribonuclease P protein component [Actinobaculum sp. 313]|nr:ribonuclease P protein component [Actinobaculum sp. 313]